LTGHHHY